MKLIPVEFIKRYAPYQPKEVAGFPKEVAEKLIKEGIAKEYKAKGIK
mgnify:CR=1 FL=1